MSTPRAVVLIATQYYEMADDAGNSHFVLKSYCDRLQAEGEDELVIRFSLNPAKDARAKAGWITCTEAGKLHVTDIDSLSLETARTQVSRGCDAGKFKSFGKGRNRRIDPVSFGAWRLQRREAALNAIDGEDKPIRGRAPARNHAYAHDDD